jgi:hypothetical protein
MMSRVSVELPALIIEDNISKMSVFNSTLTWLIARDDFSTLSTEKYILKMDVASSSEVTSVPNFMAPH